jgi:glycerol-1-phosphate dehydrogenase [NAD(P)+]
MSIGDNILEQLSNILEKDFGNLIDKKTILFTTTELLDVLKSKISLITKQLPNIEVIVVKENSFDFAVELAKYICTNDIRMILGMGGGTVLDTAKYASFVSKTTYIAIPTTLSNDGLASPIAVLYAENQRKKSFGSKIPDGLVIDISIIVKAPKLLLQAGIGDTLSNYTALYDWKLSCIDSGMRVNDFAYMLSEMSFNALLYSQERIISSSHCIKMLAQSLVLSGLSMQIAGNSRPCSGSEHLFSHAMDELFDSKIPHGILVALGSLVSCELQGRDNKALLDYLNFYDITINPQRLGITQDMFVKAWMFAKETRLERVTILNNIDLSPSLFENEYNKLLEVCK